jgi:hypothetical protein
MGRRIKAGPLVLLLSTLMVSGSCTPTRVCCEPQGADLLATGLVGWQQIGAEPGHWQLDDGTLTGSAAPAGSWLATVDQYGDFELTLEFQVSPGAEGGVYVRTPLRGDPTYDGVEVQILDEATRDWGDLQPNQVTGSLYDVQAPSERMGGKAGQWQQMVVRCRGARVRVALDGKQVVDTEVTYYPYLYDRHPGLTRRSGYIGLYVGAGTIAFRNIHIASVE